MKNAFTKQNLIPATWLLQIMIPLKLNTENISLIGRIIANETIQPPLKYVTIFTTLPD